jgi:hypothetical protein
MDGVAVHTRRMPAGGLEGKQRSLTSRRLDAAATIGMVLWLCCVPYSARCLLVCGVLSDCWLHNPTMLLLLPPGHQRGPVSGTAAPLDTAAATGLQ